MVSYTTMTPINLSLIIGHEYFFAITTQFHNKFSGLLLETAKNKNTYFIDNL